MAEKYRHLQLMRANTAYSSEESAKRALASNAENMAPGELAIASYQDSKAINGNAVLVAIKDSDNKMFYVDYQKILDKMGFILLDDTNKLVFEQITDLLGNVVLTSGDTATMIDAINSLGNYSKSLMETIAGSPSITGIERMVPENGIYETTANDPNPNTIDVISADKYKIKRNTVVEKEGGGKEIVEVTEALKLMYSSTSSPDLQITQNWGDLKAGTTAAKLSEYTISEIFDLMFFPVIYPSFPSYSFTASCSIAGGEISSTKKVMPSDLIATYTRNKATYKIGSNTTSMEYFGTENSNGRTWTYSFAPTAGYYSSIGTAVSDQPIPPEGIICNGFGTYTFNVSSPMSQGPLEVHDSKGNKYHDDNNTKVKFSDNVLRDQPYKGTTLTAQAKFSTSLPFFWVIGSKDQGNFTNNKTAFTSENFYPKVGAIGSTDGTPLIFDVPKGTSIKVLAKDTAGNYTIDIATVLKSGEITRSINGIDVKYKRFYTSSYSNLNEQTLCVKING